MYGVSPLRQHVFEEASRRNQNVMFMAQVDEFFDDRTRHEGK